MEKFRRNIRSEACARGIKALYHFTPLSNVDGILRKGLRSRSNILEDDDKDVVYVVDKDRLDGGDNLVSATISNVNFEMFRIKQKKIPEDWVIFELKPEILWEYDCKFYWKNAATRAIKSRRGFLGGPWAFQKMFEDLSIDGNEGIGFRDKHNRLESEPTRPDAEMAVIGGINRDDFVDLTVPSLSVKTEIETIMQRIDFSLPIFVDPKIF